MTRANEKSKRLAPSSVGRAKKKSRTDAIYDDPDAVLENEKSPLYKENTDLMVLLCIPKLNINFRNLTSLLQMILTHAKAVAILTADSLEPQSALPFTMSEQMKSDIAAFKGDGRSGCYDKEWVRQAFAASKSRAEGDYEYYAKERFEADWGQKEDEQNNDDGSEHNDKAQE